MSTFSLQMLCILCYGFLYVGCSNIQRSKSVDSKGCNEAKLGFDMSGLDDRGRIGKDGGARLLDYTFCIPASDEAMQTVLGIKPDLIIEQRKGRNGCRNDELLCLGDTGSENFRSEICGFTQLDYVERIEPNYWE